jgi:hypothetical protein
VGQENGFNSLLGKPGYLGKLNREAMKRSARSRPRPWVLQVGLLIFGIMSPEDKFCQHPHVTGPQDLYLL